MLMNGGEGPSGPIIAGDSFKLMTSPFARHDEIDPSEGRSYGYGLDVRFDSIVDGEAWRAIFSGADYYRFFTP
jgi:hypothetical protein